MSVILLAILAAAFILDNRNEVEIPNSAVTKEIIWSKWMEGRFFEVSHITADERYSKLAFYVLPNKNDNDFWWTHISVCRPVFPFLYYNKEAYEDAHEWYYFVHVDSANGVSALITRSPCRCSLRMNTGLGHGGVSGAEGDWDQSWYPGTDRFKWILI